MGAHPPAADEARAYAAGKTAGAPAQRRFGCPEPCTRRDNLPKQRGHISDLWASTFARRASRPDLAIGARRPQAQKVGRNRLRLFGMRRGWGKASHRPPWESAILAIHRARGEQGDLFGWRRHTRLGIPTRQTNRPSHAHECSVTTTTPVSGRATREATVFGNVNQNYFPSSPATLSTWEVASIRANARPPEADLPSTRLPSAQSHDTPSEFD